MRPPFLFLRSLPLLLCPLLSAQDQPPDQKPDAVAPKIIQRTEPRYSEQALRDKLSGSVLLSIVVGVDGVPTDIKVVKGLGEGLDEKAIEAVSQWRFQPGMKNGVPVAVRANVNVNFRLTTAPKDDGSHPVLISKVEPEYTEKARQHHISGIVLLSLTIDENGMPKDIQVVSGLGEGLDEKAIEAVHKWRFKPAMKNGVPVAMPSQVEVSFRLGTTGPDFDRQERARTIFNSAIHHLRGDLGAPKDEKAAFQGMQNAAAMEFPPAETRLGEFYANGVGTPVDQAKAAEMFDRAAFHGDPEGEYQLGAAYLNGTGVVRDQPGAFKLFTRAAQKDQRNAEFALGLMLETGKGVSPDLPEAFKWYRKSAEQALPDAQYHLAAMYWSGSAGKHDQVAALTWMLLAEKAKFTAAAEGVQQYRAAMTADQIAEAEKHAGHFKQREPNQ